MKSGTWAFDWYQNRWPWMTLYGVTTAEKSHRERRQTVRHTVRRTPIPAAFRIRIFDARSVHNKSASIADWISWNKLNVAAVVETWHDAHEWQPSIASLLSAAILLYRSCSATIVDTSDQHQWWNLSVSSELTQSTPSTFRRQCIVWIHLRPYSSSICIIHCNLSARIVAGDRPVFRRVRRCSGENCSWNITNNYRRRPQCPLCHSWWQCCQAVKRS